MADRGYLELVNGAVRLPTAARTLVRVAGADRIEWLQGQTTQDVASMSPGDFREACLCEPTGQIRAVIGIQVRESEALVTMDGSADRVLLDLAERTVFMEDVRVSAMPEDWSSLSLAGPQAVSLFAENGREGKDVVSVPDLRFGRGTEFFGPDLRAVEERFPRLSDDEYESARIEFGVPDDGRELSRRLLPPELGPSFDARHVHYQKGCYTGQEVLMRIHARGHTNRTWVGLVLEAPCTHNDAVTATHRERAGTITSCAVSPEFGPIAAALLHNDAAQPGATVTIRTANGDVGGVVRQLPLRS